jgi:hypothetical protein
MIRKIFPALLYALSLGFSLAALDVRAADSGASPVVVELFTSQSCSSCPPADAYLGELAKRPGVLALSMHVDYWNRLGWRDPYSSRAATQRQRDHVGRLGARYVSTPQAVVQGRAYAIGSDRPAVERLIRDARQIPPVARPKLAMAGDKLSIRVDAAPKPGTRARVWLVAFDNGHTTAIPSGENAGRTVTYSNVVRALRPVGVWDGKSARFEVDVVAEKVKGFDNCAVIFQSESTGAVIGAARLTMAAARP